MAGPMMSAPVSATQIAQKAPDQGAQQLKQGASKFEGVMADKAQATQSTNQVAKAQTAQAAQSTTATQAASKTSHSQMVQHIDKSDKASLRRVDVREAEFSGNVGSDYQGSALAAPSAGQAHSAGGNMMVKMMGDIEKGQGQVDQLIKMGTSGRQFSNGELISMQAMVYKYSQELELTGKVVEQATTGLKETLKTQV